MDVSVRLVRQVLAMALMVVVSVAPAATAATIVTSGSEISGILGVFVHGTEYNVDFRTPGEDFDSIFGVGDPPANGATFWDDADGSDALDARDAIRSVLNGVYVNQAGATRRLMIGFRDNSNPLTGLRLTYTEASAGSSSWGTFNNVGYGRTTVFPENQFAVFTLANAEAAVPAPASLISMGLGLFALLRLTGHPHPGQRRSTRR